MDKKKIKRELLVIAFLLTFCLCTNLMMGQENEWNSWTNISLTKNINKKLSLSFSPEVRFTEQFKVDEYFFETGLEYKLFKFLNIGGNYRYIVNERETKSTEYFGRLALDLTGKYSLKKLEFQLRTRYCQYNDFDADEDSNDPYLRYRLKLKYNISKLKIKPSIAMELFQQLNDNEITKTRTTVGLDYKINKTQKIGVKYLIQNYLNEDYLKNILSLEYKITF